MMAGFYCLAAGCAPRKVCGVLDVADVMAFHESHYLSNGANASSVEGLASEPWMVCVEGGVAGIQNHRASGAECEDPAGLPVLDAGCR